MYDMDTLLYIQYILSTLKTILTILWSAMMCELQIFIMVILSEPLHGTRLFCSLLVTLCLEIR